jgi:hypothetical protein
MYIAKGKGELVNVGSVHIQIVTHWCNAFLESDAVRYLGRVSAAIQAGKGLLAH